MADIPGDPSPEIGLCTNLASCLTAELIARTGFDWIWFDYEHGPGSETTLLHQLQAVSGRNMLTVVRVAWNDPVRVKRALDLGAGGIMFPYINTAAEAQSAVASMTYPPNGIRGVAKFTRASGFSLGFEDYLERIVPSLQTIVQIETPDAVANSAAIAAVDGVDTLFVGPLDLSTNLGVQEQYDHPAFVSALERVAQACRDNGKRAGILVPGMARLEQVIDLGYRFLAIGSDGGLLAGAMREALAQGRAADPGNPRK